MSALTGILVCILILSISYSDAARILAWFPTPSISHQVVFRPLTQELARRGHEVVVITPDPAFPKGKTPPNLKEIDMHNISYSNWINVVSTTEKKQNALRQATLFLEQFTNIFELQLQTPDVQRILKEESNKFHLLLLEGCVRAAVSVSHVIKVPIIQVSSFGGAPGQYHFHGAPSHIFLYPTPGRQRLYNLSMSEKAIELFKSLAFQHLIKTTEIYDNNMIKRNFGTDAPTFDELKNNIHMTFFNEHIIWADNHPVPPNIVYIGGIHQAEIKELPQDLKSYLDSSKNGVIYLSFGTNVLASVIPPEKVQIMIKVFSELPYDVLWKWDKEELPGKSNNIKISKWFPQADLLRHPKVKLFVTQGGLQSTDEAIYAGVPLLGIPMLGDQWYNVEKYEKHHIGIHVDMQTLTEECFRDAVETVIKDESYRKNILKLRSYIQDEPQKPLDRAVWWIEYLLRHGGTKHLISPAADLHWIEYYEVKLILTLTSIFLTILVVSVLFIKRLVRSVSRMLCFNVKVKKYE